MNLTIHRGSHQIGGSCVELNHDDSSILIDFGLPLEADGPIEKYLCQPLFREIKNNKKKIMGVLLSHPHIDHYGLTGFLPGNIQIYCGLDSAELMNVTGKIKSDLIPFTPSTFTSGKNFQIGPYTITPYLMDHSAFDSYAFLISAGGRSVFYTGDFRAHGRKAKLFERLFLNPPKADALLMEGTMVGAESDRTIVNEEELENDFIRIANETLGLVMVTTSSQNIDRIVTIFRAAKRTGRQFIIDFYTAEVLERIGQRHKRIPRASWPGIKVCYPKWISEMFENMGLKDILEHHRINGIRWNKLREIESKAIMIVRPGFLYNLKNHLALDNATWIYSMWKGYLEGDSFAKLRNFLDEKRVRFEYLHTSGHARIDDLKRLADSISPKIVIPIHTNNPDMYRNFISNTRIMNDGEILSL
jgi:ribonuclease J